MTTKIDTKAAKRFMDNLDTHISATSIFPALKRELELLQEIRNEAAVLLRMDIAMELDKLKEQMNGKV